MRNRMPPGYAHDSDFEQIADRAVNEQVRQIFDNAKQFDSGLTAILRFAQLRGWYFQRPPYPYKQEWHTKSCAPHNIGMPGPRFDTFGELLKWLFEQPEIDTSNADPTQSAVE